MRPHAALALACLGAALAQRDDAALELAAEQEEAEVCDSAEGCGLSLRQLRLRASAPLETNASEAASPEEETVIPGGWGEAAAYASLREKSWRASCQRYGCGSGYDRRKHCQCNAACAHHHNCCGDYWNLCRKPKPPAPAPVPPPSHHHMSNVRTLYHQTSPAACKMIVANGFHPGTQGWCGGGIYFATSAEATETKAIGPESHKGCILRARVDVGLVMYLHKTCDRKMTGQTCWGRGFDSVSFDPGDGQEYIVYDKRQVLEVKIN